MALTPIDLQVNIGQVHEVGRGEGAKQGALVGQQNALDEEAANETNLKKSKLDESGKGDKTSIRNERRNQDGKRKKNNGDDHDEPEQQAQQNKDKRMGQIIDVFK